MTTYIINVDGYTVPDYEKIINDFCVNPKDYSEEILEVHIADMVDIYCDGLAEGIDITVVIETLKEYAKNMHTLNYN